MKLGIIGYGKMGKAIEKCAPQYAFSGFVRIDNEEDWLTKRESLKECSVAIEFSTPQAVTHNLLRCFELKIPVVAGTTGWSDKKKFIDLQAGAYSIIYGSNFSIGANIFFKLNEFLARQMKLQPQYQASIEETHHIHKKDTPSGTAITLKQGILSQNDNRLDIPIIAHREGEMVGKHLVNYKSTEDLIQIQHFAYTREAFAHGALKAAVWLVEHPGIYAFEDIFEWV
jgi:4-hydroxy-tetrahydrodipicolinate reductase